MLQQTQDNSVVRNNTPKNKKQKTQQQQKNDNCKLLIGRFLKSLIS